MEAMAIEIIRCTNLITVLAILHLHSMEAIDRVITEGISLTVNIGRNIAKVSIIMETEAMANIGNIMIVID